MVSSSDNYRPVKAQVPEPRHQHNGGAYCSKLLHSHRNVKEEERKEKRKEKKRKERKEEKKRENAENVRTNFDETLENG